jgi:hypothetical protein
METIVDYYSALAIALFGALLFGGALVVIFILYAWLRD